MKRFTYSQVVATVFALGWATCPMVFAAERGKQTARGIVKDELTRIYGPTMASSLVDQFRGVEIGYSAVTGRTVRVELAGTTYVFDQVANNATGGISGLVAMYDSDGVKVADYDIAKVAISDDNKIDFSISVSTPDMNWVEDGTLVGIRGDPGMALASVSVDGGGSDLLLVNFSGLAATDSQVVASSPLIVTSFPDSFSAQGGVAAAACALVLAACGTILVVVVVVVIICYGLSFLGVSCY